MHSTRFFLLVPFLFLAGCAADDAAPAAVAPSPAESSPAQAAPAASPPERAAADGWSELHDDIPLPAPGRAVLHLAGEEYATGITCEGPGEYDPDNHMANLYLFRVSFDGKGETADGQGFWLFGDRHVTTLESAAGQHQERSQVTLAVDIPDGGFTMRAPMRRVGSIHEHAPEGEAVLAGMCPDGW